jgi:hypothetical protein
VALTTNPYLAPRLKEEYSYTSTPPWAFIACSRVNFTLTLLYQAEGDHTVIVTNVDVDGMARQLGLGI